MRPNRLLATAFALVLAATGAYAQEHDHAGSRESGGTFKKPAKQLDFNIVRGKRIPLTSSVPGDASGYLALPTDHVAKHPAIIVVQEWWGLNDWIMQQTDRFSQQGYVALAVDLYRGKVASDPNLAHELMRGLPQDRGVADLEAGFKYLASRPDVDASRIGVVGWCMGGGYALNFTVAEPRLAASVVNYGSLVTDPATIASIKTPLLGNFGALDQGIPPADVKAFDDAMKKAGKSSDVKDYEGAGHGFMNPNNTAGYKPDATTDAWKRIDHFFDVHLKGAA